MPTLLARPVRVSYLMVVRAVGGGASRDGVGTTTTVVDTSVAAIGTTMVAVAC